MLEIASIFLNVLIVVLDLPTQDLKKKPLGSIIKAVIISLTALAKRGLINKIYHIVRNYQFKKKTGLITRRIETHEKNIGHRLWYG